MSDIDIRTSLSSIQLFHHLDANSIEVLLNHCKLLTYTPGEFVIKQGIKSNGMYIIMEGSAISTVKILGQGLADVETLSAGNIVSELSLISDTANPTSVIAKTPLKCLFISNTYFELISILYPEIKYKFFLSIANHICEHISKLHTKLISVISNADMVKQSLFGEVIKSLTKPVASNFEDVDLDKDQLKHLSLLQHVEPRELDSFLTHMSLIKAAKNCNLIQDSETSQACYVVLRGAVQSSIIYNNKVAKLSVIGPDILFCGISIIKPKLPSLINFATCEQALLIYISEENIKSIQNTNLILWNKIFDYVCKSLVALEKSLEKLDIRLNIENYNR